MLKSLRPSLPWVFLLAAVATLTCNARGRAPTLATSADSEPQPRATEVLENDAPAQAPARDTAATGNVTPLSPDFRTQDEKNSIDVFRLAAPSTVFVTQKKVIIDFFQGTSSEVRAGSGSGFLWDNKGHVVTNFHVIRGAQSLSVTLHDHRSFDAKVVGVEPRKDIAVLKLNDPPSDLVPIRLRPKAAQLEVGQKALAIGNPFGLDQTLTTGIISAMGREVKGVGGVTIRDMVQTDAAINPGNSGGPLLDSSGHLIGMNTMIFSSSGSSAGIGFAVPEGAVRRVVPQIIQTGKAEQVGLGVQIDPAQRIERRLGLRGVVVLHVMPGTPAEKAGLRGIAQTPQGIQLGDVIVGINEHAVNDYDDLYNVLDRYTPGTVVTVKTKREGKDAQVKMELMRLP